MVKIVTLQYEMSKPSFQTRLDNAAFRFSQKWKQSSAYLPILKAASKIPFLGRKITINYNPLFAKKLPSFYSTQNTPSQSISHSGHHWNLTEQDQHPTLEYLNDYEIPEHFSCTLKNVGFHGKTQTVYTKEKQFVTDLSFNFHKDRGYHRFQTSTLFRHKTRLEGTSALLSLDGGKNYSHWLLDLLPRLRLIEQPLHTIDHFLVNTTQLPFQQESLKMLGIPESKWVSTEIPGNLFECENLICPSMVHHHPYYDEDSIQYIREKLLSSTDLDKALFPQKLFIYRKDPKWRKIENEQAVLETIESNGFFIVQPETLSFKEQINLFHFATHIIAPHGAGLTSLLFCNPETRILEFFAPSYLNFCYGILSDILKLPYKYFLGEGDKTDWGSIRQPQEAIGANINVSPDKLKTGIEWLTGDN